MEIAPYQGPFMIHVQDRIEALGREIASRIFVEIQNRVNLMGLCPQMVLKRETGNEG